MLDYGLECERMLYSKEDEGSLSRAARIAKANNGMIFWGDEYVTPHITISMRLSRMFNARCTSLGLQAEEVLEERMSGDYPLPSVEEPVALPTPNNRLEGAVLRAVANYAYTHPYPSHPYTGVVKPKKFEVIKELKDTFGGAYLLKADVWEGFSQRCKKQKVDAGVEARLLIKSLVGIEPTIDNP